MSWWDASVARGCTKSICSEPHGWIEADYNQRSASCSLFGDYVRCMWHGGRSIATCVDLVRPLASGSGRVCNLRVELSGTTELFDSGVAGCSGTGARARHNSECTSGEWKAPCGWTTCSPTRCLQGNLYCQRVTNACKFDTHSKYWD